MAETSANSQSETARKTSDEALVALESKVAELTTELDTVRAQHQKKIMVRYMTRQCVLMVPIAML